MNKHLIITGHDGEILDEKKQAGPLLKFLKTFQEYGFETRFDQQITPNTFLVSNNHTSNSWWKFDLKRVPLNQRALIAWEPRIVMPKMHKSRNYKKYKFIYAPTPAWFSDHCNHNQFKWPQNYFTDKDLKVPFKVRQNKIILMQANKFSVIPGENYSLRRNLINLLDPEILDLYGPEWNAGLLHDVNRVLRSVKGSPGSLPNIFKSSRHLGKKYTNYQGTVPNKHEIFQKYKYSIVIENSSDYVSEKLFDSIGAGCLTFYYGPELSRFNLPSDLVINLAGNKYEMNNTIERYLQMPCETLYEISKYQRELLIRNSSEWSNFNVFENLAKSIAINFTKNF